MKKVWYKTKFGLKLIENQSKKLGQILPTLRGYHLLQLAPDELTSCIASSLILHRVNGHTDFRARDDALPIANESIDVVVLTHTLEQRQYQPYDILKEAHRVLVPGGYVVISGFKLWTIGKLKLGLLDDNIKWISKTSIKKSLSLLDFEYTEPFFDWNSFFSPYYILLAIKPAIPLTIIKPQWPKPVLDWAANEETP